MNIGQMIKIAHNQYGLMFPLVMAKRAYEYAVACVLLSNKKFKFNGELYSYLVHPCNATFRSERAVEVPVACHFINDFPAEQVLEVGNVLKNYIDSDHSVVDKYEKCANVINQDIISFEKKFNRIISISTFEHIGFDEEGEDDSKVKVAFKHVLRLLNPGGKALIIVPGGYNHYLDSLLRAGDSALGELFFMKRISKVNEWREVSIGDIQDCKYGIGSPCANALAFCYITKEACAGQI